MDEEAPMMMAEPEMMAMPEEGEMMADDGDMMKEGDMDMMAMDDEIPDYLREYQNRPKY